MEGRAIKEGQVALGVRGRARRPYANCDRMPRWRSSSLSHQCPQCCTGPVPPSLSQPTGGRSIASAFETAASSGRPGISPAALRPVPLQSRQDYLPKAVRPVRLSLAAAVPAGRPPAVLRLHMEGQRCMRDMSVAPFGSGVRDAVHRLATGCVGNGVERAGCNFHYCIKASGRQVGVRSGLVIFRVASSGSTERRPPPRLVDQSAACDDQRDNARRSLSG